VEVGDAVRTTVGRREPVGLALFRPAGACGGPDSQGLELVEGEDPVREAVQYLLDPVELGVAFGVGRFLPGLGALESDAAAREQTP
jgi:hypothetical protein